MDTNTSPEALQRITLAVEHTRLSLYVPRSEERFYRDAGEEIATTLRIYRYKYPNRSEVPAEGYLAMAASISLRATSRYTLLWKRASRP